MKPNLWTFHLHVPVNPLYYVSPFELGFITCTLESKWRQISFYFVYFSDSNLWITLEEGEREFGGLHFDKACMDCLHISSNFLPIYY